MYVAEFVTSRPNMTGSNTYHDWSQFLGKITHKVGVAAQLCKNHTLSYLTDQLMNIIYQDVPKKGFNSIDAFCIDWEVDVNRPLYV